MAQFQEFLFPFMQVAMENQVPEGDDKSCRNMKEFAWTELLRLEKLK